MSPEFTAFMATFFTFFLLASFLLDNEGER